MPFRIMATSNKTSDEHGLKSSSEACMKGFQSTSSSGGNAPSYYMEPPSTADSARLIRKE